jgi:hypothetical protein
MKASNQSKVPERSMEPDSVNIHREKFKTFRMDCHPDGLPSEEFAAGLPDWIDFGMTGSLLINFLMGRTPNPRMIYSRSPRLDWN